MTCGLVVGAPRTGSGKTTLTLALLRAFARRGARVASAKIGPDFIDPRFHEAASGRACATLDGWAMRPELIDALIAEFGASELVLIEGVMGLFDGAETPGHGSGATGEMARRLGLPTLLTVDAAGLGQSVAALVEGFRHHDPELTIAGIVLNNVGSARHERILRTALAPLGCRIFGAIPRTSGLARPSRHLGLVQAEEAGDLDAFLDRAADLIAAHLDLDALQAAAAPLRIARSRKIAAPFPPPGQRIALAADAAFRFIYPHFLAFWRKAGAEILPFSPLADESPDPSADAIWLPGGYPELHAARLAAARRFRAGMLAAARRDCAIHGECGGYMVLGRGLVDEHGRRHEMLGLLPLETSFAAKKLHLGYRCVRPASASGPTFRAHEFHYSTSLQEDGPPLYRDTEGDATHGLAVGRISGSWLHVIDQEQGAAPLASPPGRDAPGPRKHEHGGNLSAAQALYGRKNWLDLSTGINPFPYSIPEIPPEAWSRLPAEDALQRLLAAARAAYATSGAIVAAPGTQAILHALPTLYPNRTAAFVAPGYGGYAEAWTSQLRALPEPDPDAADILIVGRPNNPDGRIPPAAALLDIADRLAHRGGLLVLDEAFVDPTPQLSLAAEIGRPGLLILRSFGKFFGLAGLRLGFALGEAPLIARLADRFGPWAVAGPALSIAAQAFADKAWIAQTREHLQRAAARLDALLAAADLTPLGGTPLFRLAVSPNAARLHARLARAGIWTRAFPEHPNWLRVGLPGPDGDWDRLEAALCPTSTSVA